MNGWRRWLGALLPESLATRGTLVLVLAVGSVVLPGYLAYRAWAETLTQRQEYERQALLAAALAEHLAHTPDPTGAVEDDLRALDEYSRRVCWAGIVDRDRRVVELSRRTAIPADGIAAQIDFDGGRQTCQPLLVGGVPSTQLDLLMLPQPGGRAVLAVVLDRGQNARGGGTSDITWLGLACLAIGGLGLAWAWFRFGIEQPVQQLARRLVAVQAGLSEAAADGTLPSDLADVARAIASLQRDLAGWRDEAERRRDSADAAVAARVRQATLAQRRAERDADTDPLTGLANRRVLERELPRLIEEHRRSGAELTLVMFDVDRFKALNDTCGHLAGDALLAFLGDLVRAATRKGTDLTIRYGGDEFVLALPGTAAPTACDVARRIAALFAQWARTLAVINPPPSLSFGVAALYAHAATSPEHLLRLADVAMYRAKRQHVSAVSH
jgi:diguanylate cyclase (GGDEF)-like protein